MSGSVTVNSSSSLGRLQVNRTSSGKAFVVNDNTSDTVTILGNGAATFAGNVDVGQNPAGGNQQGAVIGSAGYLAASRPNDTDPLFLGYKTGSTTVRQHPCRRLGEALLRWSCLADGSVLRVNSTDSKG